MCANARIRWEVLRTEPEWPSIQYFYGTALIIRTLFQFQKFSMWIVVPSLHQISTNIKISKNALSLDVIEDRNNGDKSGPMSVSHPHVFSRADDKILPDSSWTCFVWHIESTKVLILCARAYRWGENSVIESAVRMRRDKCHIRHSTWSANLSIRRLSGKYTRKNPIFKRWTTWIGSRKPLTAVEWALFAPSTALVTANRN